MRLLPLHISPYHPAFSDGNVLRQTENRVHKLERELESRNSEIMQLRLAVTEAKALGEIEERQCSHLRLTEGRPNFIPYFLQRLQKTLQKRWTLPRRVCAGSAGKMPHRSCPVPRPQTPPLHPLLSRPPHRSHPRASLRSSPPLR